MSTLVLLDLSAASSSTDCTELLPHLQTLLGRNGGALWSLSSPFLISAGSCGQAFSARTVTWYQRCRLLPTPFLFSVWVRPLGKPLKSCRVQHGLRVDDPPESLSYTLDDAVQCPRACQNEMSKRCQRHHAGPDWAGRSDCKLEEKLEGVAAAPCDDRQSCQQATEPVSCPVDPDLGLDIPAVFLVFLLLGLLRHTQCTALLTGQAFMWECIAIMSRSQPRCQPSPGTRLEQLCPWQSPVSLQQAAPAAFQPGWST